MRKLLGILFLLCFSRVHATPLYGDTFDTGNGTTDSTCWIARPNGGGTENTAGCRTIWAPIYTPFSGDTATQASYTLQPHAAAAHSGSRALKISYLHREELALADRSLTLDSVYFSQWLYFTTGYDFSPGNKIGRIDTRYSNGDIDADFIIQVQGDNSTSGTDDMGTLTFARNGGSNFGYSNDLNWARNTWHHVECFLKLNTIGLNDGVARCWADEVLVLETTGMGGTTLRPDTRGDGGVDSNPIKSISVGGWWSGAQQPASLSTYYIDDVAIDTARVGTSFPSGGSCVTD